MMNPSENRNSELSNYLNGLYKDFKNNRRMLEPRWAENWRAYKMVTGEKVKHGVGVGNPGAENDEDDKQKSWKSRSVADLTRVKVNAGTILVSDVLLAGDEIPFSLKDRRTTGGVIEKIIYETTHAQNQADGSLSAELMTKLIKESLEEGGGDRALAKAITSAAIYGEGVSRIYMDSVTDQRYAQNPQTGMWTFEEIERPILKVGQVSIWDFFTDLENPDIQENIGFFERRMMSFSDFVKEFTPDDPMVIADALDDVKRKNKAKYGMDGNGNATQNNEAPAKRMISKRRNDMEVLIFWGRVPRRMFDAALRHLDNTSECCREDDSCEEVECMATIVDNVVVRLGETQRGGRPYFRIHWEDPIDDITATGIADACKVSQNSLNSILRLIEDNKKLAGSVIFATKPRMFANKNQALDIYPGKNIELAEDCVDARSAIQQIAIQDVGASSYDLLNLYKASGAESSMIPEIAYGVQATQQMTAHEVSVRNEKAGKYISNVVRGIDNNWIEPVVKFFYDFYMDDEMVPKEFKGSFSVQALGFTSYQDKVLRMNAILEFMGLTINNPALSSMVKVRKLLEEYLKAQNLDSDLYLTEGDENDPSAAANMQQIQQEVAALQEQLNQVVQQLPSIAQASELDAAQKQADIQKTQAETQNLMVRSQTEQAKVQNARAATIADIEAKQKAEKVIEFN